jgi:hypothetical protein
MNPLDPRPAQVAEVQQIAEGFDRLKAADHQVQLKGREMLDHAKAAGRELVRLRKLVPKGEWIAALEKYWPGNRRRAYEYIAVFENWDKVWAAGSLREALRILAAFDGEEQETVVPTPTVLPSPFAAAANHGRTNVEPQAGSQVDEAEGEGNSGPPPGNPAELVSGALRLLVKVRELISEAYAGGAKAALELAADGRRSILALRHDGGIIEHGTLPDGGKVGVKRLTNDALEELMMMVLRAKLSIANEERGRQE